MTQVEFGDLLERRKASDLQSVVMIQCVGSRNETNVNCSRICCQNAVKNALALKKRNPDAQVYILYRDIRTYGLLEEYYTEARKQGVIFIRFEPDAAPQVSVGPEGVAVTGQGPRAAAGDRDPGRPAGAERRHDRGRHGRGERAHEAQPQPRGFLHRGAREAEAGGHAERGRLPLRHGPWARS